jgi:hypothetical protein
MAFEVIPVVDSGLLKHPLMTPGVFLNAWAGQ